MFSDNEISEIINSIRRLTCSQQKMIKSVIHAYNSNYEFWNDPESDIVTDVVLSSFGNRLLSHHAGSRQALSKDRFEFALESALKESGIEAHLVNSRNHHGHDIDIQGVQVSLKTEAAKSIKDDLIHVSKWMELGSGEWSLPLLLDQFLAHLERYNRIFTLRKLKDDEELIRYELVEIPKGLLLEARNCTLEVCNSSKQNPQPGYGKIYDSAGLLKYSLYFDGGTERKLQIKHLNKSLCKVHARWTFSLPTTSEPVTS